MGEEKIILFKLTERTQLFTTKSAQNLFKKRQVKALKNSYCSNRQAAHQQLYGSK